MPDWPYAAARWVRRLLRGREETAPRPVRGARHVLTGDRALRELEGAIVEAVFTVARSGLEGERHRDLAGSGGRGAFVGLNAFDRPVQSTVFGSARGALAAAAGVSMTGRRASVFLGGDRLAGLGDQLHALVGRRVPLVIHATARAMPRQSVALGGGHEGIFAAAESGAFVLFARNVQHAVDLTLVAHRLAELALCPGIVAIDDAETAGAPQDVWLPDRDLLAEYLGAPGGAMTTPTAPQEMLFGPSRPNHPAWFDPERPVATGAVQASDDYGRGQAGQDVFFGTTLAPLAERAITDLEKRDGARSGLVQWGPARGTGVSPARAGGLVVVAVGALAELAEAVAPTMGKARPDVVALDWLAPSDVGSTLRERLRGAERVLVLERSAPSADGSTPLARRVRAAIPEGATLHVAICALGGHPVTAADLAMTMERARVGTLDPKAPVWVGMGQGEGDARWTSQLPRRQILLGRVGRATPELPTRLVSGPRARDVRPAGSFTVSLWTGLGAAHDEALEALGGAVVGAEEHSRARSRLVDHRLWLSQLTVSSSPLLDPGDEAPADVVVLATLDVPEFLNPFAHATLEPVVVLALPLDAEAAFARMPRRWIAWLRQHGATIWLIERGATDLAALVAALRKGDGAAAAVGATQVALPEDADAGALLPSGRDIERPWLVREGVRNDEHYDNPARFWGEVAHPRRAGEVPTPIPDPYLALGAVPAGTAAFRDATPSRARIPRFTAERCTACGNCWSACPDAALAPVAMPVLALLDAAADRVGDTSAPAGKLRRAHRNLAPRIEKMLAESGTVSDPAAFDEAFGWLADKMSVAGEEREAMAAAFAATMGEAMRLPWIVSEGLFRSAPAGEGAVFHLALNPNVCQGCASCAAVCPEAAFEPAPQTAELVERARAGWAAFRDVPDTPGAVIARVAEAAQRAEAAPSGDGPKPMSRLAATLLSRHTQQALAGGNASEPGSNERLATRLVAGVVERWAQERAMGLHTALDEAAKALDLRIVALRGSTDPSHDAVSAALAGLLEIVSNRRAAITGGPSGVGRARFGVAVTAGEVGEWAARFPHNPFFAPVTVELGGDGAELALGLQQGLLLDLVATCRLLRRAKLYIDSPPDFARQDEAIDALTWRELSAEERSWGTPLLLLADAQSMGADEQSGLSRILTGDLPVKVVLLDRHEGSERRVDPTLLALAHRSAYVLSSALCAPDHLYAGTMAALSFDGPALLHLYAPSPLLDGFETHEGLALARLAVDARVHPLVSYDPTAEGVFGARVRLEGNPELGASWLRDEVGEVTPARWAEKLERLSARGARNGAARANGIARVGERVEALVAERSANWRTLQELAGVVTPFTASVRAEAEKLVADRHAEELAALRAEYEGKLEAVRAEERALQMARLQQRLVQLATMNRGARPNLDGDQN
jgi:pyruvate-ferredoxin/flavodoxin oxidoreductase